MLATLLAFAGVLVLPARAAAVSVQVTLTGLRFTGSGDQRTVVLTGTVTNNSAQPAFGVHVVLWRSRDPIRTPEVLRSVASGQVVPWGDRLHSKPDHYYRVTDSTTSLDPGKSHTFVVRATLPELGFTVTGAAYVFGVQVLGTADASSNYSTIGRARSFLALPTAKGVPVTTVVVLASAPSKLRPDVFADDHLAGELTGRLNSLLNAASQSGTSYLVDPSLYDEVADMADGYQVQSGETLRPGTGQEAAAEWLARFRLLPATRGARTLYAGPDVLGAAQAGDGQVLTRAVAATRQVSDLADLPLVVLPFGGLADAALLKYLKPASAKGVLATTADGGSVLAPGATPGTALVRTLPAGVAGPDTETGPVQRTQRQLAEAVVGGGLVRLVTDTTELPAKDASPGWLHARSLPDLLAGTPRGPAATLTLPAGTLTLPPKRFADLDALSEDYDAYADLVPDSRIAPQAAASLSRAASGAWLTPADGKAFLKGITAIVGRDEIAQGVRLDAAARFLMSSKANFFPVTITNNLPEPIRVRVVISSENPQRLTIPPSGVVTVDPGQSETVNVRPEATANGLVNVAAHVETETGHRVTPNTRIAVDVTDLGLIGWIIVIASGTVLVAATAWRIRQVRRAQAKEQE